MRLQRLRRDDHPAAWRLAQRVITKDNRVGGGTPNHIDQKPAEPGSVRILPRTP